MSEVVYGASFSHEDEGIVDYLKNQGLLSQPQLDILYEALAQTNKGIRETLVVLGYFTEDELRVHLSNYLKIPVIKLTDTTVDPTAAQMVSEEMAIRYNFIPLKVKESTLEVAMADPVNLRALNAIQLFTGFMVKPYWAKQEEIKKAIQQYLTMEQSIAELSTNELREEREYQDFNMYSLEREKNSAPIIKLVNTLLEQALNQGASDIHWEPGSENLRVRFRLDGELSTIKKLPLESSRNVIARLKVMARMDVSERRLPQDGRITLEWGSRLVDLRVSSMPTVYGEKLVLRVLDPEGSIRTISELGMRVEVLNTIKNQLKKPHGLILVAGPTGSGKTTTLYAMLQELVSEKLNIVSIEDPVEYRLNGIYQVPVQSKIGLTFGNGLRSILRQDPDIIMIGEIRDEETARIAVTAALTGHLVLSTVHANTSADAISRLLDIGIERYLLASALVAVLSQRLVRRLCPNCCQEISVSQIELQLFPELNPTDKIYQAKGCSLCRGGYIGRLGIQELLLYDEDIKQLVLTQNLGKIIEHAAREKGMNTLIQDGLAKATRGLTTITEVIRVASLDYK